MLYAVGLHCISYVLGTSEAFSHHSSSISMTYAGHRNNHNEESSGRRPPTVPGTVLGSEHPPVMAASELMKHAF